MCLLVPYVFSSTCGRRGEADQIKCPLVTLSAQDALRFGKKSIKLPSHKASQIFPGLNQHQLGSCAVVGLSESLLSCQLGADIDSQQTVFRMGFSPLKGFASQVGAKATFTLCRSPSCQAPRSPNSNKQLLKDIYGFELSEEYSNTTILLQKQPTDDELVKPEGALLWYVTDLSSVILREYSGYTVHSSSGFGLAVDLLASGVCTRIHVFGMGHGLRRYSYSVPAASKKRQTRKELAMRRQKMKRNHAPDIEMNVYRRLKISGYPIDFHKC